MHIGKYVGSMVLFVGLSVWAQLTHELLSFFHQISPTGAPWLRTPVYCQGQGSRSRQHKIRQNRKSRYLTQFLSYIRIIMITANCNVPQFTTHFHNTKPSYHHTFQNLNIVVRDLKFDSGLQIIIVNQAFTAKNLNRVYSFPCNLPRGIK